MRRRELFKLLRVVEKELVKARVRYKENKEASDHMQKTAAASWSGAGDREYAKGQEEINKFKLDSLEKLRKELESGLKTDKPQKITAPSYVKYKKGHVEQEIYFVGHVVHIAGFKLISNKSPIGVAIEGLKVGDNVEFKATENTQPTTSEIVEIG